MFRGNGSLNKGPSEMLMISAYNLIQLWKFKGGMTRHAMEIVVELGRQGRYKNC